jgi:methionyl-tRNA formyltransferase
VFDAICSMADRLFVLGTFDQAIDALFDVDLMRCLAEAGVPPRGVIYKRSASALNPSSPVQSGPDARERLTLHVDDFNAPAVVSKIAGLAPDLLVYAGGRDILRRPLLQVATHGCLGGHYGRLPAVRGMGTVEWSVMLGEAPTVAIQRMSSGIDTGDVVMQAKVPLLPRDTFVAIRNRSYFMTKVMLALAARRVLLDGVTGTPQQLDNGRQYYRLHPALQQRAERLLQQLLKGVGTPAA